MKDIFQRNVEVNPKLGDSITSISYELRMCGATPEEAVPSLLIFCPNKDLKTLKTLLTKPHIKAQYAPDVADSGMAEFDIFFWGKTMELLAGGVAVIRMPEDQPILGEPIEYPAGGLVPWGVQVSTADQYRHATMGCIIHANSLSYGLTTAHVFHDARNSTSDNTGVYVDFDEDDEDDDEYDLSGCHEDNSVKAYPMLGHEVRPMLPWEAIKNSYESNQDVAVTCRVLSPPDDESWTKKHSYGDWALLEISQEDFMIPVQNDIDPDQVNGFSLADELPAEETEVLIITSRKVEVQGTLYTIPAYVGGTKGSMMSELWAVNISRSGKRKWCTEKESVAVYVG